MQKAAAPIFLHIVIAGCIKRKKGIYTSAATYNSIGNMWGHSQRIIISEYVWFVGQFYLPEVKIL